METQAKEKKKWKTPHTFVILVVIIIIAAVATYIVPAGEFARYKDAVTGKRRYILQGIAGISINRRFTVYCLAVAVDFF